MKDMGALNQNERGEETCYLRGKKNGSDVGQNVFFVLGEMC